jgi:hypothetical protein
MPSGRDSFRRNRVAPSVLFYFTTPLPIAGELLKQQRPSEIQMAVPRLLLSGRLYGS